MKHSTLIVSHKKTAMEAALGMLYFKRLMVAMKHVGLNVPADVFMNSAQPFASDLLHI